MGKRYLIFDINSQYYAKYLLLEPVQNYEFLIAHSKNKGNDGPHQF